MRPHSSFGLPEHSEGLSAYLQQIGEHPLLGAQDEIELSHRVREGDDDAFEQMTLANLRLVVHVARQFRNKGVALADLIEEGNIGLMRAVRGFDPTRGFRFSTYAVWLIRQSMENAVLDQSRTVRLPERAERELRQAYLNVLSGTRPVNESSLMLPHRAVSTDTLIHGTDSLTVGDSLPAPRAAQEQALLDDETKRLVSLCLNHLPPRDALILQYRFGLGGHEVLTLKEIGEHLQVSAERVRQLEQQVLQKLRHFLGSMHLDAADVSVS